MKVCTFFGHRDCPTAIRKQLREKIEDLVDEGYDYFMVGNQGRFDQLVQGCLREINEQDPLFGYAVVLHRFPQEGEKEIENSIVAEGIENCPPRFRIDRCNEYMLKKADTIICYVKKSYGGAAKFVQKAIRQNKRVIYLKEE